MVSTRSRKPKCLVTGGAGFLGKHLVDALVDSYDVSIFDIKESGDSRVRQIVGDIRELQQVVDATAGEPLCHPDHTVAS